LKKEKIPEPIPEIIEMSYRYFDELEDFIREKMERVCEEICPARKECGKKEIFRDVEALNVVVAQFKKWLLFRIAKLIQKYERKVNLSAKQFYPLIYSPLYELATAPLSYILPSLFSKGGFFVTRVRGESMTPTLEPDDFIIEKPLSKKEEVKEGEIVTYVRSTFDIIALLLSGWEEVYPVVCHRVTRVDKEEGDIITKGDNNKKEDPPVDRDNVISKVIRVVKKGTPEYQVLKEIFG